MTDKCKDSLSREMYSWVKTGKPPFDEILAKYRTSAVEAANKGDLRELAFYYDQKMTLNEAEENVISDVLNGRIEVRDAPKKSDLTRKVALAHFYLSEVEGWPKEAAISEIMDMFQIARSTAFDHLRFSKQDFLIQMQIGVYRWEYLQEGKLIK